QRPDMLVAVSKGRRARDVLEKLTSLEEVPANKLFNSLEISSKVWGGTLPVNLVRVIATLMADGEQLVLTGIDLEGPLKAGTDLKSVQTTDEPTILKLGGLSVFRHDKLVGWLTYNESEVFNFVKNNIDSTIISIPCQDGSLGIEV